MMDFYYLYGAKDACTLGHALVLYRDQLDLPTCVRDQPIV